MQYDGVLIISDYSLVNSHSISITINGVEITRWETVGSYQYNGYNITVPFKKGQVLNIIVLNPNTYINAKVAYYKLRNYINR